MLEIKRFGIKVFNDKVMKTKLPNSIYKTWKETIAKSSSIDKNIADAIANAMKEWALELGCTHYCHWFQPLTGTIAKKNESFIEQIDGEPILKLSGKSLIKGEADASSFPTGGLRTTYKARGYTYWDCLSPAFIRENILYIPSIFVSFNGESLDNKWPLLKSIEALSKEATRIVNIFGDNTVTSVMPVVGLEQEYFLIDKNDFIKREDLYLTGRTLFGAAPTKSQEIHTHYLGIIPSRVKAFMNDVNNELWELGIYAKSEHNEAAPAQFELATLYSQANISVDQNQIVMNVLTQTALKHDLICLLHEKPFSGFNGSGKHNNWSLLTNTGINLFNPSNKKYKLIQFLIFLCGVIQAIDKYAGLLFVSSSNPGNDFRLGSNEAPTSTISIYLGSEIEDLLTHFINDKSITYAESTLNDFGIPSFSYLPHDNNDRNRTSPISFATNKFEFRILGASMNAAFLNTTINTIVTDSLKDIADQLEKAKNNNIEEMAKKICLKIIKKHSRVLYNGDCYSNTWINESKKRKLPNYASFLSSISVLNNKKVFSLFSKYHIFNEKEIRSRISIAYYESYNTLLVEYKTLIHLTRSIFIPTLLKEINLYHNVIEHLSNIQKERIANLSSTIDLLTTASNKLEKVIMHTTELHEIKAKAEYLYNNATSIGSLITSTYSNNENSLADCLLDYPTLSKLLFGLEY